MEKFFPLSVVKSVKVVLNKAICLSIVLSLLFNLTTPVFAARNSINQEEELLLKELNQTLQAEYLKKTYPVQDFLELCLNKSDQAACDKYLNEVDKMFFTTAEDTTKNQKIKQEEEFTPLSKKNYIKDFNKNTEQEFNNKSEEIKQEYQKKSQIIETQYKGIGINTPEYSDYILAKTALKDWQTQNLQDLIEWKKNSLSNIDNYYQEYLSEFEKNLKEYNQDKQRALNDYLRSIAQEVFAVYEKAPKASKLQLADIFVYLLSMESEQAHLFTSAQKSEIYKFFNKLIYPSNNQNPCAIHSRQRNAGELKEYNAWQDHLARMEKETQGTLSARDQIAKQTRSFEQGVSASLQGEIVELASENSCQAAMSALVGLSYYKGWDMSKPTMFMIKNATEPMAAQVLLVGTKTLIETSRLEAFNSLILHMIDREAAANDIDDLKLKEAVFYKGKFYKTPYIYSRYSQEDGGGDVWQDIAQMLAKEKTKISQQIQQEIFDRSISFSIGTGKISFNHNLPFVYGLILHNPKLIDNFVPSSAVVYSHGKYDYKGKKVYFQYYDNKVDLYIQDEKKGAFYLADSAFVKDLTHNIELPVSQVKQEAIKNFKENKTSKVADYFNYFKVNHKDLKPSAVYAEAFYKADFIDLTLEEKLAMDRALEQKYPHLKKLSKTHKYKLERNRVRADRTSGSLVILDIALTLWFVSDIYKGIKWSVKSIKAIRQLFTAGKTIKGLSNARRIAFLRTFAKNNPYAVKLNRSLNKIKTMPQRFINNFPKYKSNFKQSIKDFDAFMAQTSEHMAVPSAMPGQRLAVQNYNNYLLANEKRSAVRKAIKYSKVAKISGPITIIKKDGKTPLQYKHIKFNEEGFFEVDKDFLKTFKANIKVDDIAKYRSLLEGTIADLKNNLALNEEKFAYLTKNLKNLSAEELLEYEKLKEQFKLLENLQNKRYITFRGPNNGRTLLEKWKSHKRGYDVVPLYDAKGNIVADISLDLSIKSLVDISNVIKQGNKLILQNGNIMLAGKVLDINIGVPKEVISLLAQAGRKVEDFSFLTLTKKSSKMWPLFYNNMLSLSAGSTSLNMSLNQAPFNNPDDPHYIPQPLIFGISVGFPYAFSLFSPMVAPFVKRYGATNVQTTALLMGGAGLAYATFNGYYGFASKKRDSRGRPIYDENGKTIPADKAPSYAPLVVSALTAGICSALTRASLNTAIHRFQTSKASMAFSMLAKNIGSLSMVLIPWGAEAKWGKDNVDFSISYPVLTGLSVLGIIAMKGFIPSSVAREAGYKIMPRKTTFIPKLRDLGDMGREVFKPFVLFGSSKIMPYYLSYLAFGGTEAFALFKTFNTFTRDSVDDFMKNTSSSKNANKLLASVVVALPSALVRGFVKRKTGFSQGIFNSIILTTAGTLGLMLPSDHFSDIANLGIGMASGYLIACGTANMYQYLQKRMIAGISDPSAAGVLPLARKFSGISGLQTTAISFYSGAYIGSFIPFGYSFLSEKEVEKGASDFYANQSVLPLALGVYGWGVIPLALTNTSRAMFGKVSPYSMLFSLPLGSLAIRDLYRNSKRHNLIDIPFISLPFNFDRNFYINPANKNLHLINPFFNRTLPPLEEEHTED